MKKLNAKNLYEIIDRNLERTLDELYPNELERIYKEYCIASHCICDDGGVSREVYSLGITEEQKQFVEEYVYENGDDPVAYFIRNYSGRFAEDPEEKELCKFILSLPRFDIEEVVFNYIETIDDNMAYYDDELDRENSFEKYFEFDEFSDSVWLHENGCSYEYLCPYRLMRKKKKGGE